MILTPKNTCIKVVPSYLIDLVWQLAPFIAKHIWYFTFQLAELALHYQERMSWILSWLNVITRAMTEVQLQTI